MYKSVSAEEAVKVIKNNDRVYIHAAAAAAAAAPQELIKAMSARHGELRGVEICHLHTEGEASLCQPKIQR